MIEALAFAVLLVALVILTVDDALEDRKRRGVIVTSTFLVNVLLTVCAVVLFVL